MRERSSGRVWAAFLAIAAVGLFSQGGGCAAGSPLGAACATGDDCESGACADGVCVDPETSSSTGEGGSADGGAGQGGASSTTTSAGGAAEGGGSPFCEPAGDGEVTRAEYPAEVGLSAKFLTATDVTVSTAGEDVGGTQTWDFDAGLTGDHLLLLETRDPAGSWWQPSFPDATYAARLSDTNDLLGVFQVNDDAVLLLGVVSPQGPGDNLYYTELTYDPPVTVLAFPLQEGDTWTTDSNVTGYALGVFGFYDEEYVSNVDARGDVITPFATFDALRVRTVMTRRVNTVPTLVTRSYAFVTECFGTIATLSSQDNESAAEFDDVAEIKRLSP